MTKALEDNVKSLILFAAATLLLGCGPSTNPDIGVNTNSASISTASPTPTVTPRPMNTIIGEPAPHGSPLPPDAKGVQAAIDVVHEYYAAINAKDYRKAYELWSGKGEASKQTFESFSDGFTNTASVEIDTSGEPGIPEGAAGSQYVKIPLLIKARTKDGHVQNFWGEYTLRRSMVDGATADQRAWRLYSAQIKEL